MHAYEKTSLWRNSLGSVENNDESSNRERLRVTFNIFRSRLGDLTNKIAATLPNLTIHDITHLDALWETADIIAGPEYQLNPMEAFVFGGAVLLHDSALCFEAYENGRAGLQSTAQWKDAHALEQIRNSKATEQELTDFADFAALRALHAKQAKTLVERAWRDPSTGDEIFLIDDVEIRKRYAAIIGSIASSHHWTIEEVAGELQSQINAYAALPASWRIDPIKLACLLRCADATHIDSRRAPDFLYALTRRQGISFSHWKAQNWLARLDVDQSDLSGETALITSNREFLPKDFDAWWVAYDAITLAESEISASNALLQSLPNRQPFKIKGIAGATSPELLSQHIRVKNWKPWSATLHVSNVEQLIQNLGGSALYGTENHFEIVLRELIQNSRDAIAARRSADPGYDGAVIVRLKQEEDGTTLLEVEDDGIGMSERVMTGPLLDFGQSFWTTDLVKKEFPGLRSSKFRNVGQFGIGFYSLFMISDSASVRSRNWDSGLKATCTVSFPKGLSLRPVISIGNYEGFTGSTSTIVRCQLKPGIISNTYTKEIPSHLLGVPSKAISISELIAGLVPGLDVTVKAQIGQSPLTIVHYPILNVVKSEDRTEWLAAISLLKGQGAHSNEIQQAAARLRPIFSDTEVHALAALSTHKDAAAQIGGCRTIGGFATTMSLRGGTPFIGFMEVGANSAKRDGDKILVSPNELARWADEQIGFLRNEKLDSIGWCHVSQSMANLDLDPLPILHAPFLQEEHIYILNIDEIFKRIESEPIAFFAARETKFVDTFSNRTSYEKTLTFLPVLQGNLLSLKFKDGRPSEQNSFIGCLDRYARSRGQVIEYHWKNDVARNVLGPIDVLLCKIGNE